MAAATICTFGSLPTLGGAQAVAQRVEQAGFDRLWLQGDVPAMAAVVTDGILDAVAVTATWDEPPAKLHDPVGDRATDVVCDSVLEHWRDEPEALARWQDVTRRFREWPG